MEILTPRFKRNGNAKVVALYSGIASGNRTVVAVMRPSLDGNRMETTREYGTGLPRGTGGCVAVLVLGGMETTLDEMEYILAARQEKKFLPQRTAGDIVAMCRLVAERRNEQIMAQRKLQRGNPSLAPQRRRVRLHLPVGVRYVGTSVPGLKVLARV